MRRTKVAIAAIFCWSSSVFQTAVLALGRSGSSRLNCSTLPFLPARVRNPFVRGSAPTQEGVNNGAGMEQLAEGGECL